MKKTHIIYSLLILLSVVFLTSCKPNISVKDIEKDIVGRRMGKWYNGWTFAKNEPRSIKILKAGYNEDEATIIIHLSTRNGGPSGEKYSGKIRLKYNWISPGWDLIKIENISFGEE